MDHKEIFIPKIKNFNECWWQPYFLCDTNQGAAVKGWGEKSILYLNSSIAWAIRSGLRVPFICQFPETLEAYKTGGKIALPGFSAGFIVILWSSFRHTLYPIGLPSTNRTVENDFIPISKRKPYQRKRCSKLKAPLPFRVINMAQRHKES